MSSNLDSGKKDGEISGTDKLINDLGSLGKVLFVDKLLPPRLPLSSDFSKPQKKQKGAKNNKKDSSDKESKENKEKKPSIWSWKRLKALTYARNRRFNCCFSLQVHSIEGLPPLFDDVCVVVHWKRKDIEQKTCPVRVNQGVAEFEEQLIHSSSVNCSRSGFNQLTKYEAKHFLLYVSIYNSPELDFGKHRVELTRLFPLTFEELEESKSSGKWSTSFLLSGKARGAILHVSFGYVAMVNNSTKQSGNNNVLSFRQRSLNTESFVNELDDMDELSIHRVGSLPARLSALNPSTENLKDLHEVSRLPTSELCESVNLIYQKRQMSNASVENLLDGDPHKVSSFTPPDSDDRISSVEWEIGEFSVVENGIESISEEHKRSEEDLMKVVQTSGEVLETDVDGNVETPLDEDDAVSSFTPPDSDDRISSVEWEIGEFSVVENGIESISEEHKQSEEDLMKVVQTSGEVLETDVDGNVETPLDEDDAVYASAEELVFEGDEPSISNCNSTEERNEILSKESLLKELETALSYATNLMEEEELIDSQEDETDVLHQKNSVEDIYSDFEDRREGESVSLDDVTDSVASEFLDMLGLEQSPFGLSSESETDSPREQLLKQFENDPLANGGLLNFDDIDNKPAEFVDNNPTGSLWEAISKDFHHSSIYDVYKEIPDIETPKMETDAFTTKTSASRLEDLETKDLMHEWGLNEKAFQHSPPRNIGSPVDETSEDVEQLPPLAEGVGPFAQIENGGFLRSMNPALFKNAMIGGSLIMQVSSPVVVPSEMGSGVMDILQGLAAMGIKKLSMQANKLMPLEDVNGKTIEQIAPTLDRPERQGLSGSTLVGSDTEYVSLEDLALLTMDKIEALSMEGLRIQSGISDDDGPSNITTQSIGEFSALKGVGGTGGLQLLNVKDQCEEVDRLMSLSITLDEWVKLDSGEIDDDELASERTSRILAAHHATSSDVFRWRSNGAKKRGLLGNNFTVALMVRLLDPLRNYEPVGIPMLGLIQVKRSFVPKISRTVPLSNANDEEQEKPNENPTEEKIPEEELIPQYKITNVHVVGLKTELGKKKLLGSKNQQQSGSRWLLANGMGKKKKHPLMKSKVVIKNSDSCTITTQPGDTLWSISCRVHGTGERWKELAELNPHIRNPNVVIHDETIRLR